MMACVSSAACSAGALGWAARLRACACARACAARTAGLSASGPSPAPHTALHFPKLWWRREAELDALIEDSQRRFKQAHLTDEDAIASAAEAAAAADGGSAGAAAEAEAAPAAERPAAG